jgi:predicted Zn-dependent protease
VLITVTPVTLSPSDAAQLQAVQNLLRAGKPSEASCAVEKISREQFEHPEVLEVRLETCAQLQQWEPALALARSLCQAVPESEFGWLYQACSLDELHRIDEAFAVLLNAVEKLPNSPAIPYNLACCACKLGHLKVAAQWLARAAELGGRAEVKLMALSDPAFAPLLDDICALQ